MAAAVEFSIRGYVASMRAAAGVDARRPFGIADLPPMQAPSNRWWADDLASAVAATASSPSPRRSMGRARTPKKRSISDLFAAAPPSAVGPSGPSGGSENPDVDDDEALCAIVMRAREEKRRKRKLLEEGAAEGSGSRQSEGNFATRKEALDKPNMPDGLDTRASNKLEGVKLLGKEKEQVTYVKRRKQGKNNNTQFKDDSAKYTESKKASKVGKPRGLGKMLPLRNIMKKYTKRTYKMVKEKPGSSKGKEVIELRRKSVKRVKFSEVNDVLGSKTQSCKLPEQQIIDEMISDVIASTSLSMSSSSLSMSTSGEGSKYVTTECISSHRPEEALTQNKEAYQNTEHECPELPLIDLNKALPESADLDFIYNSNSEVPNVGHTHEGAFSGVQVLDGTENQRDLSSDLYGMKCQQPAAELESIKNSRPADTLLHSEAMEADIELSSRELDGTHRDSTTLVKDDRSTLMSPCSLPDRTVQDQFQHYHNGFSTNLNHGGSQLSTGGDTSSWQPQECNMSWSAKPHSHSGLNVQDECRPPTEQTVRLMGKDLTLSTSRGECSAEMAGKHVGNTSSNDYLKRDIPLELPKQSFFSLHGEGFPNVSASPTGTSHVSSYSAGTSQTHSGYRILHDLRHPFPAASAFSAYRSPNEHRFVDFSNPLPNQRLQVGHPPLPNHGSAAFHQSSLSPWRNYSNPLNRTEPSTAPVLLASRQHGMSSSVPHGNLPQPYSVHPASSSVRPHNSASFMFNHPGRIDQEASGMRRDAAVASRNLDNRSGGAIPDNVRRDAALPPRNPDIRTVTSAPDNPSASSSGQPAPKRPGLVKLTPGAKHILVPNEAAGDNSAPVYSYFSFGGKSANASSSQNKGA